MLTVDALTTIREVDRWRQPTGPGRDLNGLISSQAARVEIDGKGIGLAKGGDRGVALPGQRRAWAGDLRRDRQGGAGLVQAGFLRQGFAQRLLEGGAIGRGGQALERLWMRTRAIEHSIGPRKAQLFLVRVVVVGDRDGRAQPMAHERPTRIHQLEEIAPQRPMTIAARVGAGRRGDLGNLERQFALGLRQIIGGNGIPGNAEIQAAIAAPEGGGLANVQIDGPGLHGHGRGM